MLRNFFLALWDQKPRDFFWTGNAWGLLHKNSHMNKATGKLKVMYNTKATALKAATSLASKHGVHFSAYKCMFCDGYHIGKNRN